MSSLVSSVENILIVTQNIQSKLEEIESDKQNDIQSLSETNAELVKENLALRDKVDSVGEQDPWYCVSSHAYVVT